MTIFNNYPFSLSDAEKRAILPAHIDRLVSVWNWAMSNDIPITREKKLEIIAYGRALKRLDLSIPDSIIFPDMPTLTPGDFLPTSIDSVQDGAVTAVKNIPGWATWTKETAYTWGMTNIGTPLAEGRANLPATLTLATARIAIVQILNILDAMWTMQMAYGQMLIAMRNDRWPGLQE